MGHQVLQTRIDCQQALSTLAASLLKKREEVRNLIWSGDVSWGGIDTAEAEYNNLAPGADFVAAQIGQVLLQSHAIREDFTLPWDQRKKKTDRIETSCSLYLRSLWTGHSNRTDTVIRLSP